MTRAELHRRISYVKSGWRMVGYALLLPVSVPAAVVLIASEILGVAEEAWGS